MDRKENKRFIVAFIIAVIFLILWLLSEWSVQTITPPVKITPNYDTTSVSHVEEEVVCSEE